MIKVLGFFGEVSLKALCEKPLWDTLGYPSITSGYAAYTLQQLAKIHPDKIALASEVYVPSVKPWIVVSSDPEFIGTCTLATKDGIAWYRMDRVSRVLYGLMHLTKLERLRLNEAVNDWISKDMV